MAELHSITPEDPAEDVVATLERALATARAGDVSSVAIALVYRDGRAGHCWSRLPSFLAMMGSIDRIKFKLNSRQGDDQ